MVSVDIKQHSARTRRLSVCVNAMDDLALNFLGHESHIYVPLLTETILLRISEANESLCEVKEGDMNLTAALFLL